MESTSSAIDDSWKRRLLQSYVSSGQAEAGAVRQHSLRIDDYPFYRQIIRRFLPSDREIRIADLGCGHGPLVFCLKSFGYRRVQGVDVSSEQVALALALGITDVAHQDIGSFLSDRKQDFDVVFLMDILEHFTKNELLELLDRVYASLAEGGIAIIHVPNGEGLFGMGIRYGDLTHEICFTPQSMNQALRACGFCDVQCYEDKPVVHGTRSLVRRILWNVLTVAPRLLLLAETGNSRHVLSRNMLVVAKRREQNKSSHR